MKYFKKILFFTLLFSLFLIPFSIQAKEYTLPIESYINDYADVLSIESKNTLNQIGSELEKDTGAQVVFIIVDSLNGQDIRQTAYRTFKKYQLGNPNKDNGVLFIVSLKEKQRYMEVGRGLESTLTDIQSQHLQQNYLVPYFQESNYELGITNLYTQTIKFIYDNDTNIPNDKKSNSVNSDIWNALSPIGIILILMFIFGFTKQKHSVKGIYLQPQQEYQLQIRDYDFESETILISSENESIVSVQANGWIKANQIGQTSIKIQKLSNSSPLIIPVIVSKYSNPSQYDNDDILNYLIWGPILTPRSGFGNFSSGHSGFNGFSGGGGSSRGGGAGGSW